MYSTMATSTKVTRGRACRCCHIQTAADATTSQNAMMNGSATIRCGKASRMNMAPSRMTTASGG